MLWRGMADEEWALASPPGEPFIVRLMECNVEEASRGAAEREWANEAEESS